MPRSLNSVQLIGNLTRDPELRYTQSGRPVCDVGLATSRQWKTESGEKREEVDFHKIVVWGKLGEICSQYLHKGQKAYFQGRLSTRKWTAQDGTERQTTEIIADDMLMLGGRDFGGNDEQSTPSVQTPKRETPPAATPPQEPPGKIVKTKKDEEAETSPEESNQKEKESEVDPEDIPF